MAEPTLDALIVGGGPAGLATAIAARQAGLARVRVLDRAFKVPIDKACGEGLMPDGVAALAELGVTIPPGLGAPFRGIRYVDGGVGEGRGAAPVVAEGRFPVGGGPFPWGLGLRRLDLHRLLIRRAEEIGVEILWDVKVLDLVDRRRPGAGVVTSRGPIAGRFVVAADGLNSRLRGWAGLAGRPGLLGLLRSEHPREDRRFGVRHHVRLPPWTDLVEVHWGEKAEAYVTPVGPEEVGVAFLWSGGPARFDELLGRFPALAERLAGIPLTSRDRGAGPLRQRVRRVRQGNFALVGDASGYVDAITGEGLSLAFHQALALGRAMAAGDLAAYDKDHRRIGRLPDTLTRLMLGVEARPWLRRRLIRALAAEPELFHRLLGVHCRAFPLRRVGMGGALRLAFRLAGAR